MACWPQWQALRWAALEIVLGQTCTWSWGHGPLLQPLNVTLGGAWRQAGASRREAQSGAQGRGCASGGSMGPVPSCGGGIRAYGHRGERASLRAPSAASEPAAACQPCQAAWTHCPEPHTAALWARLCGLPDPFTGSGESPPCWGQHSMEALRRGAAPAWAELSGIGHRG